MTLQITPETKVGALLEAYPGIEDKLSAWVPAFAKLKNPVLRKTVTKVVTLDQAAQIAGIETRELVRRLLNEVGQPCGGACGHGDDEVYVAEETPAWVNEGRVRFEIDADSMLAMGVHPIGRVRESAAQLQPGELVCLTSGFRPVPLIDTMRKGGLAVYSEEISPGRHATYFARHNP